MSRKYPDFSYVEKVGENSYFRLVIAFNLGPNARPQEKSSNRFIFNNLKILSNAEF